MATKTEKHYILDEQYIPSHDLSVKMLKKYPELHASYDGALFFNDGKYPVEDFVHGLWIESKDVPWARGWQEKLMYLIHRVFVVVLFQRVDFMFIVVK